MSDDKGFLARWSRRKRDAAPDTCEQSKPVNADGGVASESFAVSYSPVEAKQPFDPANLPPIDSISAGSDIRAFLAAGVPADLTRAALRRAWSTDPTIRDFVGLSENSWDFNAPGAMPGFGAIDMEEARRLVTQLMGEPDAAAAAGRPSIVVSQEDKIQKCASEPDSAVEIQVISKSAAPVLAQVPRPQELVTTTATNDATQPGKVAGAAQYESVAAEHCSPTPRRGHGSALPHSDELSVEKANESPSSPNNAK